MMCIIVCTWYVLDQKALSEVLLVQSCKIVEVVDIFVLRYTGVSWNKLWCFEISCSLKSLGCGVMQVHFICCDLQQS